MTIRRWPYEFSGLCLSCGDIWNRRRINCYLEKTSTKCWVREACSTIWDTFGIHALLEVGWASCIWLSLDQAPHYATAISPSCWRFSSNRYRNDTASRKDQPS